MPKGIYKRDKKQLKQLKKQGFEKGHTPWNKDTKGIMKAWNKGLKGAQKHSEETKTKMSERKIGNTNGFEKWKPSWSKGLTKESDERVLKMAQNKSGENHPRWIKNRELLTRHLRNDPEYKQWSKKVKDRDNWKCKINNKDCSGKLIAHHILSWKDFPELRYNINNGITLCQAHHPRKRAEEKRLIPFLQGLVPVLNV